MSSLLLAPPFSILCGSSTINLLPPPPPKSKYTWVISQCLFLCPGFELKKKEAFVVGSYVRAGGLRSCITTFVLSPINPTSPLHRTGQTCDSAVFRRCQVTRAPALSSLVWSSQSPMTNPAAPSVSRIWAWK